MSSYRHEAFLYADHQEFMDGTLGFIRDAVAEQEPILIVLDAPKIAALQSELRDIQPGVLFADMGEVGLNPARIIPAWRDFIEGHSKPGHRLRGIGEPIWPAREPAELTECQRHEALLNLAFADCAFWLLCPYDTQALEPKIVDEARRDHPFVREHGISSASHNFAGVDSLAAPFAEPLSDRPAHTPVLTFSEETLLEIRQVVAEAARRAGLARPRAAELELAVHEVAANSVAHGGGGGTLHVWLESDRVVCEVRDRGHITDALIGRRRPDATALRGRGLWIANQLCDLVQLRSLPSETVVRLHMHRF